MWEDGVYLGVRRLSGEIIVRNAPGVRGTTVQRKPLQPRWQAHNLGQACGGPWAGIVGDDQTDRGKLMVTDVSTARLAEDAAPAHENKALVSFAVKHKDLDKHGFSA